MTTLRSLAIGDCDHYVSPYLIGVREAMARLGHEHREVSIRQPVQVLARAVDESRPNILWTHMLLWAPQPGSPPVDRLVNLMERAARGGARVIVHDGDYKDRCRHPHSLNSWCALALVNHAFDRSPWCVPTLRWPYFAQVQDEIAQPDPAWACDLFFAGQLGKGPVYAERTRFLNAISKTSGQLRMPTERDGNTLAITPAIAASADAILGFGRPGVRGWVDTRVFQYPGAGGILIHDDVAGYLEPWVHYVPYQSGDAASVVDALARLRSLQEPERRALRERAFAYVQEKHNSVARVRQVLAAVGLA